ncbi:MAG: kinase-like domain-containing protein [Benniella sp.]|nr:MAG: kinase-like domain-containing protein [Benniella sp.]
MSPSPQSSIPVTQLPWAIDGGRLILQDMLGVGAYGSVYRAMDTLTGQIFAVKSLNKTGLDSRQRAFQNHEAKLHGAVSGHPNIITLHRVIEDESFLYMVLDCGMEGDLFYTITERGGYIGNMVAIKAIFGQIASAVMHCHANGVFHRDLKPENIIMFGSTPKLMDFGLATTERISSDFGCGSSFYLSPECQGGYVEMVKSYDSAANDVWSLGVILINLVFGRNPWKQACPRDETFSAYVLNHDFLQTILPMSAELNDIIKSVFCLNPKKRITLPELASRVQACRSFTVPEFHLYSNNPAVSNVRASAAAAAAASTTVTAAALISESSKARRMDDKMYYNHGDKEDSGVDLCAH